VRPTLMGLVELLAHALAAVEELALVMAERMWPW
jgi:hypothetical protein